MLTLPDIFPYNCDIAVSIGARLFMNKAKSMHELMGSHSWPHAPRGLQRQDLTSSSLPQEWPAALSTTEII